jgi:hypothetical protein
MHIKSVKAAGLVVNTPETKTTSKSANADKFEAPAAMSRRNAEIVLASSEKAVLKAKLLADATFQVLESERSLELAAAVRNAKAQLRDLQKRHEEGGRLSKSEMLELRRALWEIEVEASDIQTQAVCETLINCADHALFDLLEAIDSPQLGELVLGAVSNNGVETLAILRIVERPEKGRSLQVTSQGIQRLRDALVRISEVA